MHCAAVGVLQTSHHMQHHCVLSMITDHNTGIFCRLLHQKAVFLFTDYLWRLWKPDLHSVFHDCLLQCTSSHGGMQRKEAIAYGVYACTNTFLPTAVAAIVLFYGGNLVLQGHMSAGALVSFMLYQQSLSSAFQVSP